MQKGKTGIGSTKHGKSGTPHNVKHFTGKKSGKKIRRKGHTHKQRKLKSGKHINKYEDLI